MSASTILSVLPLGALNEAAGFGAPSNVSGTGNGSDNEFAGLLGAVMDGETSTTKDPVTNGNNVAALAFALPQQPILPVSPVEVAPTEASEDTAGKTDTAETVTVPSLLPDSEMPQTPAQEPETGLPIIAAPLPPLAMAPVDATPEPAVPAPATRLNLNPEVPLAAQLGTDESTTAPDATQTEILLPAPAAQEDEAASSQRSQQIDAALRQTQNPQLQAATATQALQAALKTTGEFKSNAAAHRLDKGGNALTADMAPEQATTTTQSSTMATHMAETPSASAFADQAPAARTAPAPLLPTDAAPEAQGAVTEVTLDANGADAASDTPMGQARLSAATFNTTAEIAAQFVQKLGQRVARFDMVLTPETLGTVEIAMEVGADGDVKARMVFDTPAAANELRARAEELRRQLNEAGFQISENALEFTDRESDQRGGFQQFMSDGRSGRRAFAGSSRLAEEADAPPPVWQSLSLAPSGVDMKV